MVTGTTYNAAGQVKTISYANGVTTTYGYSATRGWLDTVSTVNGATAIESLTYTHDFAGRITAVTGARADESWTYGYNDLDQLLSAANTNSPALSQSFTYDIAGNLTSNSAVGSYSYPAQGASAYQPHAVSTAGSWTFGYDANGNQTSRMTGVTLDRTITYDGESSKRSALADGLIQWINPSARTPEELCSEGQAGDCCRQWQCRHLPLWSGWRAAQKDRRLQHHALFGRCSHSSIALIAFSACTSPLETRIG